MNKRLRRSSSNGSSIGSSSRRSSTNALSASASNMDNDDDDDNVIEDNANKAFENLQEEDQLNIIFQCFQDFVQNSAYKPLITRSKNINNYSMAFVEYIPGQISKFADETIAGPIVDNLQAINKDRVNDLYIIVSKKANVGTGKAPKSVITRTKSFRTDVGESQSTQEPSTPKPRSKANQTPKTPGARGRRRRADVIPESEGESDENDN